MKTQITIIILLIFNYINLVSCTIGVASGKTTVDGRPLLWKTRDYEVKSNIVYYTYTDKYNFISNITPEYGYKKSWFGINNKGLGIVNTNIDNFPDGKNGPENGEFMYFALKSCATVDEFQHLLDSTNITGRTTKAIFGLIDSLGNAIIFEVNANHYWKYDANDKNIAPHGYIIRTNFTLINGGTGGVERYKRANVLVDEFYKGDSLSVKSILKYQIRDMADSLGNPLNNENNPSYFYCKKNLCTPYSIAATVILGVKNEEPAYLTTMWTMLGNPFSSIAIPYWAVGKTPKLATSIKESSLYGISFKLKKLIFDLPNKKYVNVKMVKKMGNQLLPVEDSIYLSANNYLSNWRQNFPTNDAMILIEEKFANYAYENMLNTYNKLINNRYGKSN